MLFRTLNTKFARLPDNMKGALILFVAAALFSVMIALIKLVGERIHVTQILLVRQIIMVLIVAPTILRHFPQSLKTNKIGLHMLRNLGALVAMLCGFHAVINMPLADATAIGFAKSFFVTVFAIFILHEKVGLRRWAAVGLGFVGVMVMVRPGSATFDPIALYALAGSAAAGMVMVIIRLLSRSDQPVTILTYQAIFIGIVMIIPAYWYWIPPTSYEWGLLVAIGLTSYGGQMLNIHAYKWGEASVLASLDYVRLLYATLFGYLLFSTLPGTYTWIGAIIIVGASIYTVQRERVNKQTLSRSPDGRGYSH